MYILSSRVALKVILNINQDEYITTGNEAAGARLVIHSQDAMPYPEDVGVLITPGMLTSVHVSRVSALPDVSVVKHIPLA